MMRNFCILLIICCFSSSHIMYANINQDSLVKVRQDLKQIYDSSKAGLEDTTLLGLQRIQRAAEELIKVDEQVISKLVLPQKNMLDSLNRQLELLKNEQLNLNNRNQLLNNWIIYAGGIGGGLLLILIVILIINMVRKSKASKFKMQLSEQERMITEYRRRMSELQTDMDNTRNQSQDQLVQLSQLEAEKTELLEELRKLNDSDRNADSLKQILEERVQKYKDDLEKEYAERKEIERELQNILNRIKAGL